MKEIKTVNELMAHLEELKHNLTGAKPAVDATEEQEKVRAAYNRAFWEHIQKRNCRFPFRLPLRCANFP